MYILVSKTFYQGIFYIIRLTTGGNNEKNKA